MRLSRTASRARNGIENSVNFDHPKYRLSQHDDGFLLIVSDSDVQEFGNPKTHYDYEVSVSLSDLVGMIDAAAKSEGDGKEYVKKELEGHLGKLIKLVNLCAE